MPHVFSPRSLPRRLPTGTSSSDGRVTIEQITIHNHVDTQDHKTSDLSEIREMLSAMDQKTCSGAAVEERIVYVPLETYRLSTLNATWGNRMYVHCEQPYTWRELIHGYKGRKIDFKSESLGRLIVKGRFNTWACVNQHYCSSSSADDQYFCFVYDEVGKVFVPWDENSRLGLVKSGMEKASSVADRLKSLQGLLADGIITESDFQHHKGSILGSL